MHKLRVPICYNGYTYYVTDGEAALSAPRDFLIPLWVLPNTRDWHPSLGKHKYYAGSIVIKQGIVSTSEYLVLTDDIIPSIDLSGG
ncbi:hypothetical protein MGG_17046 [Pyricularia oryzae 70-15]|uniref:Uncharacterized protein n=3 Tax=Pyricularia oryzae TaxID=318829 RepID=G4N673_PYRO7|nr:uncharacterized protein MGG_17046 [Pyricularia oryzae 70-15]EHA49797.1 hypothetical protein MGG_17046 [Pyricularia oryzae 70-15]ELQ40722.1 hypothetical protein OOU_Y34scaffold00370g16 [Pyricularia oryzae Y34]